MAIYAVGDVQGCLEPLRRLLHKVRFDRRRDRLWLAGDLVNRGPDSVGVLRFVRSLGRAAVVVLGNHDLHLLARVYTNAESRRRDTLGQVLEAPDRKELLDWLRRQPLMHVAHGWAMVHAGLLPEWSVSRARELAREVEEELRGRRPKRLFEEMYGDSPARWSDDLRGADRHRVIINAMTRMRMLDEDGEMVMGYSGHPSDAPRGLSCWFDARPRASRGTPILFGHWAALGLMKRRELVALDTGCAWGRRLTAVRLSDRKVFQVRAGRVAPD